jgi:hypothetical protein
MLNKAFKNTENALIEWLWKDTTRYFTKIKVYMISLVLSLAFKTAFGNFLAPPKAVFKTRLNTKKNHVYFDFRKIPCDVFPKPLNKGIFSVFEGFI